MSIENSLSLGRMIRKIEIDGTIFYVRGLTLGEYLDLSAQNLLRESERMWFLIGVTGLVGWENLFVEGEDGENKELEFSKASAAMLPEEIITKLGKYVYHSLTILSEEEDLKFRGYMRFALYMSDDKNKAKAKTFNCKTCIEGGFVFNRTCGKFTQDQILEMRNEKPQNAHTDDVDANTTPRSRPSLDRYKRTSTTLNKPKKIIRQEELVATGGKKAIRINKFDFPECPVSWVDDWIKTLANVLYQSEKSNIPMFSGGLMDQPYKMYTAGKSVVGEANTIEKEEFDERNKK